MESEAFCNERILGWISDELLAADWENTVDPEHVRQLAAACPDRILRARIKQACGHRVGAALLTSAGCYGVRYLAAVVLATDEAMEPLRALAFVLQAMGDRVGTRPGEWLNSLAVIGHRIAGELYTGGTPNFYRAQPEATR